nr:zinc finger BED domain-containing protein DAYSLEEPER-like [Ipomoea batatas]
MKFASNESIGISRPQLSDESRVQEHMEGYLPGFAQFQAKKRQNRGASKTDLDRYLEDEVLPMTSNFDILTWWKLDGPKYPTLQAIARDVLAIPVSTVASESCFSTGGRLISPHRSRLHPNIVEALACCQNWLLAEKSINAESSCTIATILDDDEEMQNEVNSIIIDSD